MLPNTQLRFALMVSSEDLRFFALLVRQGNLAAAARALGVTPPAVTLRLQGLEKRIGVRLLDRSTRHATPTSEGELMLAEAEALLARIDALADGLRERGGRVAGELRVVAPFGFGRRHAAPLLAEFRERNPQLKATLSLSERPARDALEGFDLALHIGLLRDSSLVAYRVAENARFACASPAYLRRAGKPKRPADLHSHACLVIRENDEDVTVWKFKRGGETHPVRLHPALASNDGEVVRDWALAGHGVAIRSEWDVAPLIAAGRLVRVLPGYTLPDASVVALVAARRGLTARSRAFVALLRERLAPPPWRR
jgi:DNA-binding transcriptional LysR family regulator